MDNSKINEYVKQLEIELDVLPKKDRDNHIIEVKDHLLQSVTDGKSVDEVLKSFLPPNELAKEIIAEFHQLYSMSSTENRHLIKQKGSKIWMILTVVVAIIIFAIFLAIAVFMGNLSDTPTDKNGIIEYEKIED